MNINSAKLGNNTMSGKPPIPSDVVLYEYGNQKGLSWGAGYGTASPSTVTINPQEITIVVNSGNTKTVCPLAKTTITPFKRLCVLLDTTTSTLSTGRKIYLYLSNYGQNQITGFLDVANASQYYEGTEANTVEGVVIMFDVSSFNADYFVHIGGTGATNTTTIRVKRVWGSTV